MKANRTAARRAANNGNNHLAAAPLPTTATSQVEPAIQPVERPSTGQSESHKRHQRQQLHQRNHLTSGPNNSHIIVGQLEPNSNNNNNQGQSAINSDVTCVASSQPEASQQVHRGRLVGPLPMQLADSSAAPERPRARRRPSELILSATCLAGSSVGRCCCCGECCCNSSLVGAATPSRCNSSSPSNSSSSTSLRSGAAAPTMQARADEATIAHFRSQHHHHHHHHQHSTELDCGQIEPTGSRSCLSLGSQLTSSLSQLVGVSECATPSSLDDNSESTASNSLSTAFPVAVELEPSQRRRSIQVRPSRLELTKINSGSAERVSGSPSSATSSSCRPSSGSSLSVKAMATPTQLDQQEATSQKATETSRNNNNNNGNNNNKLAGFHGLRGRFRALGQLVSFVQTSRQRGSSITSGSSGAGYCGATEVSLADGAVELPAMTIATTTMTTAVATTTTTTSTTDPLSGNSQTSRLNSSSTAQPEAPKAAPNQNAPGPQNFNVNNGHTKASCLVSDNWTPKSPGRHRAVHLSTIGSSSCKATSVCQANTPSIGGGSTTAHQPAFLGTTSDTTGSVSANQTSKTTVGSNTPLPAEKPAQGKLCSQELRREKKAAKTLAIITGVFVCCWLPFFVNALAMPICGPSCTPSDLILSILLWLGYLNSLLNPIIYTIFSPDFRRAFRQLLCLGGAVACGAPSKVAGSGRHKPRRSKVSMVNRKSAHISPYGGGQILGATAFERSNKGTTGSLALANRQERYLGKTLIGGRDRVGAAA